MKYLSILLVPFLLIACNSKEKKAAEQSVQDFYQALRKVDSLKIKTFYPDFEKLGGYYKSNKIEIKEVEASDNDVYIVKIENSFKNGFGSKFKQEISFFCKASPSGKFQIQDSKGLYGFSESKEYLFATQTGFIKKKNDLTDQEIASKILKSQDLLELFFKEKIESLRKEVVIEDWGWDYGYVKTYADGHGKVVNNSNEDFGTLKYTLTFVADDGSITKTDDGYLGYDTLKAGTSRDFTTLSSGIGNATKAYIQIQFDSYEILEQIYNGKYAGNEVHLLK